ncbi:MULTISPECIES: hypothetical protein [unclassified Sphingomonas]|uniref:hypothetical protein n=1 Tax=unclassified Sphingomonas TaxID=196159 RepID=UPI0012E1EFB2|nr:MULTISPECIES: hypothetical protein [unclassified Sphingomonas]
MPAFDTTPLPEMRPWRRAFGQHRKIASIPVRDDELQRSLTRSAELSRLKLTLLAIAFVSYGFRDAFTGPVRYYLAHAKLAFIWFVPDMMAFAAVAYFVWYIAIRRNSAWGILFSVNIFLSLIIGWLFMSANAAALFSAVKMMSPIFLGFAFAGRSINELRWARYSFLLMSALSVLGLLLSPYVDYPWTGMSVETFGQTKAVGRVWWSGGAVRYGGFAGDSTMAAYMALFPFILVCTHYRKWFTFLATPIIGYALYLSTNKTAMGCGIIFLAYYLIFEVLTDPKNNELYRKKLTQYSFALVLVPFILMIALSGIDLQKINPSLFSMQDRINSTWVFPFIYLSNIFPAGLITGCGLGCFVYPMDYTSLGYLRVPVDNFYVSTYIMLGFPFAIFVIGAFLGVPNYKTRDKILLMFLMNIYAVTVQCYGPSTITVFMGYCFSDMFLTSVKNWKRRYLAPSGPN